MPSRFLVVVIIAFWLAVLGWFACWDVWPHLHPGEQPYSIDLAREVTSENGPRNWKVYRNGKNAGSARSWVTYNREDDTYSVLAKYTFDPKEFTLPVGPLRGEIHSLDSTYRVTRDGGLREVEVWGAGGLDGLLEDVQLHVIGRVGGDGMFASHWDVDLHGVKHEFDAAPIVLATNYGMLSPMQPWNRLYDVQENRTWRLRLFDPLADSLKGSLNLSVDLEELDAGVLQGTDDLPWNNRNETCQKIEYRGKDLLAYTWVRKRDGLVLRQEAFRQPGTPQEEHITLERQP
jgi:hypothetical protein